MSLEKIYSDRVNNDKKELVRLKNELAKYTKNLSDVIAKINRASNQLSKSKTKSTINSKLSEINREERKKQDINKKIAKVNEQIAKKEKDLSQNENKLIKEQQKNRNVRDKQIDYNYTNLKSDIELQKNATCLLSEEIKKMKEPREKINILFLGANPDIIYPDGTRQDKLKLDKEAREIREAITKSLKRDSINFETRWAVRTSDLFQAINEVSPTIIHFSGHGTDNGELVLQDNHDQPKFVDIEAIVKMIEASTDNLRLVVFNNCYSSLFAEKVSEIVEASIGMNDSISDEAAIAFSSQLYSSIGFGNSLEKSYNQAKSRVLLEGLHEDSIPELYLNQQINASEIFIVKK